MSLFKQAFDGIIDEYNNMFNYVYPSRGKKGFTERNLTCRFCKQLELQAKKTQFNTCGNGGARRWCPEKTFFSR
jgi:hypothetical protein